MSFTAHIRTSDKQEQSVQTHCRNTAELASRYVERIGLYHTANLSGLLHDIGKLTDDFNAYIHDELNLCRGELDHSFAGAKYLAEMADHTDSKALRNAVGLIGRVILSHHGLHDWVTEDAEDTYQKRIGKEKYYEEILQNLADTNLADNHLELLRMASDEIAAIRAALKSISRNAETFAFYLGLLERLLQSALIDADRTDTADFMSGSDTEAFFDTERLWREMQVRMQNKLAGFSGQIDAVSLQRQSISDRCAAFAAHDVGICKLIVPTGGGKTLSSLRFAADYAASHNMERIIYIAPFMSILEQNSDVIREIAGEGAFLEHHSDMLAEVSAEDGLLHEYELRTEKWDSPVIATTMVQFLNALFSGRSSAVRRMHRLTHAVIIVDEVQSIPLKCVYLFNLAMNFLRTVCGSTVVLCSATQPPFEALAEFPLLLDRESSMTGDTEHDFAQFQRTKLVHMQKKGGYSFDEAAAFCAEQFRENGSLLVVVNTKQAAKILYQRLCETENASVYHLSTNMCPQHRRDRIREMRQKLAAMEPVICVTTQLIEAGVDISFGCVVRSLAGMDNAAQAAGRCNRNGEFKRICPVYILELWEEKLGSLIGIGHAQAVSRELLEAPADTDFLGVPQLSAYFGKLYSAESWMLRYPLREPADQDLINLLALNEHRTKTRLPYLKFCGQAFKTAGRLFEVIDSRTTNVIVPYDVDADKLIADLCEAKDPRETVRLLRKAQKYTVSIYAGTERMLSDEGAVQEVACGGNANLTVRVLDSRFYDDSYGITAEGGMREVLVL